MKPPYSCLTAFALLAASTRIWAAPTQIAQESFEGGGGSIGYSTSVPEFIETATSPQTDYFSVIMNDGSKIEGPRTLAGADGTKIFCAEDIDTPRTSPGVAVLAQQSLTTNSVNIAGKINTQLRIKLAAPGRSTDAAQYDNAINAPTAVDFVMVEVSIDGGAFQRISQFSPSIQGGNSTLTFDADGNNLGDSTANPLTAAFQEFTYPISTGNTVAVKVTMHSNATGEYIAVDDIRIFGETAATNPPAIANVPAGNLVFTEGGSAAAVAPALTVTDSDSANLTSASVVVSQGLVSSEDVLAATPSGALAAGNIVYTAATGTLAITGNAPLADYQAVLRSVAYQNTNVVNPSTAVRRLTFLANDGSNPSNSPFRDVNVIDNINTQPLPFTESFETDGRGTRYSVDGGFSNPPSMFSRTQPGAVSGLDGSYAFGVENVDDNADPTELVTFRINAGGASGLTGELRVAAGGGAVYDNNAPTPDFLTVEASADGGAYQNVLAFHSDAAGAGNMRQDTTPTDSNNVGDGTQLTSALQTFSFNLPTATTLTVRIRAFTNIVGENILFDRLVINGPPPPAVASVSSTATNGSFKIGDVIPVTVAFSSAVNVTGTPQITLETGATDRTVNYTSGSGSTTLVFNYTVQAGDSTADLDYLSTSALALNGGTIASTTNGDAAVLTLPSPGAAGSLGANKALAVDGVVPTIASVNSSTADGAYKIGDAISIQTNFLEAVTVTGTPQLTLETGAADRIVNYISGSGTSTLTFTYTVQAGDNSADLDYLGSNALALNGGTIRDAAGNNATLTLAAPGAAGSLGANKALVIDGVVPTATLVVANNNLSIGETSLVTITFNEPVTGFTNADLTVVNGTLSAVSSSDGGITWTATLTPTTGVSDTTNLITLDKSGVADVSGNAGSGSSGSNNYAIDTVRPTATIVVADSSLIAGETSLVTVTFSEAVTGLTNADLTIANGTLTAVSSSDGGITWTAIFTPTAGINDATNLITLSNIGVQDAAGNSGTGTTDSNNYAINTQRPTATIVMADPSLRAGETSLVTITFSESVTGFTNADLSVANGTLTAVSSSDGGITWTATFTPSAGITDATNLVTLDNTGVQNAAGNSGTGTTDSNNYSIDTTRPTATLVVADDNLMIGETSPVTITFSEAVTGFTNADLNIDNGTLSAVSSSDGGLTWTATLTPTPNVTDATNVITLANTGVTDLAGNAGTGTTTSNNYSITSLSISIAANAASAAEGTGPGTTAFTFTVSRTGSTAGAVTMDYAVSGAAVNAADFGGTLPSGQFTIPDTQASAILTINASKDSTREPSEAFTVTLGNATGGYVITTASASSSIDNDDFEADLAITKTDGVTTAVPGGSVTYTITASNAGLDPVTGATVADTFPASLTATWTAVGAGGGTTPTTSGSGNINAPVNLPVGGSVTFTVSATISPAATGTLSNTATVTSSALVTDTNPANNSATDTDTLTPQADLAITKTDGVISATPGTPVAYTITVSNAGPSDASGVTVADTFPAIISGATWTGVGAGGGTGPASGSGNINASTVNLPAGGSFTFTVTAPIAAAATGTLSNTATVAAPAGVTDPNPANNSATDTDTLTPKADLAITLTDSPDPANAGGNLSYTINLTNNGPSDAASTSVSLPLPADTTFVSAFAPGGWTSTTPAVGSNGTVTFDITNLPTSGSATTFTVVAKLKLTVANNSTITATATATTSATDPAPGNNSASTTTTARSGSDLRIVLTDSPDPVIAGTNLTYSFQVTNNGPLDANSVSITDTLPAGTTFVSLSTPAGWTATTPPVGGTGTVTITKPLLTLGDSGPFTLVVKVSPGVGRLTTLTDTVAVTSTSVDIAPGNETATANTWVASQADLVVQITGTPNTAPKGSNVTYAITLTNNGPSDADMVHLVLPIPASMTFVSATTPAGWSGPVLPGMGPITLDFFADSLASGTTVNFTVVAKVNANAPTGAILTAIVTASSGAADPVPANNIAADITSVGTLLPAASQPITTGFTVNPQTGLFDVNVKVTNTTPLPIHGFRLHVNFDAYKAAYPSLRLENATSTSKKNNVYIDYPNTVAVNATVTVKLSFYTSTRTFPSPFKPVLSVDLLPSSMATPILGGGVQASLVRLPDKTIQLSFPTVAEHWYRVRYSSDLEHWTDCPVSFKATSTTTLWIDSGPPYTVEPPANTPARFYLVDEINAPSN